MGKKVKLSEINVPLDEPKGKLFPKRYLTKSNFESTLSLGKVKKNIKTKRAEVRKGNDVKQVKLAEKFVFSVLVQTLATYGIYRYVNGDILSVILGAVLVALSIKEIQK